MRREAKLNVNVENVKKVKEFKVRLKNNYLRIKQSKQLI
jgi:hypothetical protein